MSKQDYICEGPVKHNGQEYGIGDPITLDDKKDAQLIASSAVVSKDEYSARSKTAAPSANADAIKELTEQLDTATAVITGLKTQVEELTEANGALKIQVSELEEENANLSKAIEKAKKPK